MRSDIIRKIYDLPLEPKEHLLNLLDHGDLPIEDIEGKELSILKNKKIIEVYEGKRTSASSFTEYAEMFLEGLLETIQMIINEIVAGISAMGEEAAEKPATPPKKKVAAQVNMPPLYGGIYDLWKYIDTVKGLRPESDIDSLVYSSSDAGKIIKSVMKGKVKYEGIIFMPYFRAKYVDSKSKTTKYEVLVAPKFREEKSPLRKDDVVGATPRIRVKRRGLAGDFKLIK